MKKVISLILSLALACGFCFISFADNTNFTTNISATEVNPRRAEPVEVRVGVYFCRNHGGDSYVHYVYRTYLVPAGKTLVCVQDMVFQWEKNNYTFSGRTWDTVSYYESTYQIV